ncbi:MAG TPA: MAPEG family protein [Porticoccaceae bacterium]|nr:MAPEG family protein [Porticoccaceae bacterium]HIG67403.1 MAPEG family protein [Porticoccaceae bacterium]
MTTLIIYALALALVQFWILPATLNLKNMAYLLSNRDGDIETSAMYDRVSRAAANYQESLPAFLALCLLSVHMGVDLTTTAAAWLGLRVAYLASYTFGIPYLRTVIWLGSLGCLISMAMQLS